MLTTMLSAGLRVSEVVALKGADVNLEDGQITVREGKGCKDRALWIDQPTQDCLRAWNERRRAMGFNGRHAFFLNVHGTSGFGDSKLGEPITQRTVQLLVKRLATAAELEGAEKITPHTLRHTFASWKLREGCNICQVQEMLGHEDLETTMIYTHVSDEELRLRIQGLPAAELDPIAVIIAKLTNRSLADQIALAKAL